MDQIAGTLKVLGPSRTVSQGVTMTTYSHIEIGDRIIKKVMVFQSMNGPLQLASQNPGVTILFIKNGYLCGIRTPDGKIYASEMAGRVGIYVTLVCAAFLGLITLPIFGMGLFFLWIGWRIWKLLEAKNSAAQIPNAVFI
jgi:hypothetical protein